MHPPPPRRSLLLRWLPVLGLAFLCYLLGAAVMYFELPSSSFLRRAFIGGAAWRELNQPPPVVGTVPPAPSVGRVDNPDKTCDGFTLLMYGENSQAVLINMRGEVVHRWHVPFSELWPDPTHLRGPIDDAKVYFNDGHVYPNGDLAVVIEGPTDANHSSNGYGLAKLDKDSHVLWKYAEKCHHDLDVGEDGTIYALVNELVDQVPVGLDVPAPCMVDVVDVISPEGKRLKRISLLDALKGSAYAPLFWPADPLASSQFLAEQRRADVLHTNAVKVLSRALAPKFPLFKAGQLLVSPRNLSAVAVIDPDDGRAVWAARGPWVAQHDPSFLDNGHLLLFDNLGLAAGSRVLEYDPQTQAFPWSYPGAGGPRFLSRIRGMAQRLPNGNTLIVNSDGGEAFEVTPGREVVWSCSSGGVELNRARRYTPEQLPFLKGGPRARP